MSSRRSTRMPAAVLLVGALALPGCAPDRAKASDGGRVSVAAAFYALEFVAGRVGGDRVDVRALTKAGAEPHDIELSPRDIADITDSDVVVHLAGFQPVIDEAARTAPERSLDVTAAARLDLAAGEPEQAEGAGTDPHFWLDPTRLADVADAVAGRLATSDNDGAQSYAANAAALRKDLLTLDAEYKTGLATCAGRRVVTTHTSFAYLARAYGLTQVGIAGSDPEAEPKAADVARIIDVVQKERVSTIFFEPLVSRRVADTVASATGARVELLDPIEGIDDKSTGEDYLTVMRGNLAALRTGLGCA